MKESVDFIPEHPEWRPWDLAYAEYEGKTVVLMDGEIQDKKVSQLFEFRRYRVAVGPSACHHPRMCPYPEAPHMQCVWDGDSLEEAQTIFQRYSESLIPK